jgi:imidazolonepropionase-like amidohydrolase
MTPFEALSAATVNPAKALGLEAGTIEAGKLADLVMVEGDPSPTSRTRDGYAG